MDSPDNRSRSGSDISRTRSLSTSLATQESLNNMSSKFGGRTPVRIYFLDNSSKMFLLEPTSTALDVIKMILQKLDVTTYLNITAQYFGLYESLNGATIDSPLDFEVRVSDVISRWIEDNGSKLVFMIRLFVPSIWGFQFKDVVASRLGQTKDILTLQAHLEAAEVIDSQLLHLQYNQCVYNVITGQYPTTPELALELGVYHFIYKFGAFDETRHHLGFLSNRIVEFLPFSHLRGSNIDEWEQKLLNNVKEIQSSHSALTGKRNFDPQRRYVETVMLRLSAFYGCAFFRCSQTQFTTLPSDLYVAIHRQGIYLVEKSKSRQILRQFHLQELNKWGYKTGILFYFEAKLDGKDLSTVEFGTRDGLYMAYLLTDYVHAFLQEAELEKSRGVVTNTNLNTNASNNNINNQNQNHNENNNNTNNNNSQNNNNTSTQKMIPPVIAKSQSLGNQPPPPPPPRPKSMSVKNQSSNVSNSSNNNNHNHNHTHTQYTPYHHKCATKIQSLYRGYALRNEWILEDSAILIQAVYRGYAERCRVSLMLEELFHSGQLEILDDDEY